MIRYIKLLRNIGVFDSVSISRKLERVVLIYAENSSGKSTLAEILRSLEIEEPSLILKKHRFESEHTPHVILECDGIPDTVMFQEGDWGSKRPPVRVFDEAFVASNVYSGLDVAPGHRQKLHNFVLGKPGVDLSRRKDDLAQSIEQYNHDIKEAERSIPEESRHGFSMDDFCNLQDVPDVDAEIKTTQAELDAVIDADTILQTPAFEEICIPEFDQSAIRLILQLNLDDLNTEAAASVAAHIESLGDGGESWVSQGMKYIHDDAKTCPFCRQSAAGISLLAHYQAYFSEAYDKLKRDIGITLNGVLGTHSENSRMSFVEMVGANKDRGHVWAKHCDVQMPEIDIETIIANWKSALDLIVEKLREKQDAPLECLPWDDNLLEPYEHCRQQIVNINSTLDGYNDKIMETKESARLATVDSIKKKMSRFKAIQKQHSPAISAECNKYLQAKVDKASAEDKKRQVTQQLKQYRTKVFPELQDGVNDYLSRFGARFTLIDFKPVNIRTGSTCNYGVRIKSTSINTARSESPDDPSIGETLSTGDRNTLALAFFLSSLAGDENLSNTTVVVDDPVSSLDENRTTATVQELLDMAKSAGQMIVLSHRKAFLGDIWRNVAREECLPLSMVHSDHGSTICVWDVGKELNGEQSRRQRLLEKYAKDKTGSPREVVNAIRPYLEAFLEASCASHYNASMQISSFLNECVPKCGTTDEILGENTISELQKILEYANPRMHDTSHRPERGNIVGDELRTYVRRTLGITKPSVGGSSYSAD